MRAPAFCLRPMSLLADPAQVKSLEAKLQIARILAPPLPIAERRVLVSRANVTPIAYRSNVK